MNIAHPEMNSEEKRFKSFNKEDWPHKRTGMLHPRKLAEAGFFFEKAQDGPDRCVCFSCGLSLVNWEANDNPFLDHLKHLESSDAVESKQCTYMELLKQHNPSILGLDDCQKMSVNMDGLPEVDDEIEPEESLSVKEYYNQRKDFMKCILLSTLVNQDLNLNN